jgi:hypothetical protein
VIYQVLELRRAEVNARIIPGLITLAMNEMTTEKDVAPDWQTAASQVETRFGE